MLELLSSTKPIEEWAEFSERFRARYSSRLAGVLRKASLIQDPVFAFEDLCQECEVALMEAVIAWQAERVKRIKFCNYVHWHVLKMVARVLPGTDKHVMLFDDHDLPHELIEYSQWRKRRKHYEALGYRGFVVAKTVSWDEYMERAALQQGRV